MYSISRVSPAAKVLDDYSDRGVSRRDFLRNTLFFSTAVLAHTSFPGMATASERSTASKLILLEHHLDRYSASLDSFLKKHPLKSTNWLEKRFWDGGDDGLIAGALDYDLVGRALQLFEVTKNQSHFQLAKDTATFLHVSYIEPNKAILPAYRIYCVEGFHSLARALETSDPALSKILRDSVNQIATSAAYAQLNERNQKAIFHPSLSREVALLLLAKTLASGKTKADVASKDPALATAPFVSAMKNQLRLFRTSLLSADKKKELWGAEMKRLGEDPENYLFPEEFVRPFMVAISARSAAMYVSYRGDRELAGLAADALLALTSIYVRGRGLPYTDRVLPAESRARQLSSDVADDEIVPALNHMVANACDAVGKVVDGEKSKELSDLAGRLRADTVLGELTLKEAKQANY